MNRTCPKCNHSLLDREHYFCLSCGEKLESSLISLDVDIAVRKSNFVEHDKGKNKGEPLKIKTASSSVYYKLGIIILVFIVSFSTILGIHNLVSRQLDKNDNNANAMPINSNSIKNDYHTFDLGLNAEEYDFFAHNLLLYVPFEVNFYLEGRDLNQMNLDFLSASKANNVYSLVKNLTGEKFMFFGRKNTNEMWELALVIKKSTQNEQTLPENDILSLKNLGLIYTDYSDTFILTNSQQLANDIDSCSRSISKNITHHPKFSSYKALLPASGQMVFMNFTDNKNLITDFMRMYEINDSQHAMLNQLKSIQFENFVLKKK